MEVKASAGAFHVTPSEIVWNNVIVDRYKDPK